MPYIPVSRRDVLHAWGFPAPQTLGELDYCITYLLVDFLGRNPESFAAYAGVMGVLDYVADETKRKMSDAYERLKEAENGPVYPAP